MRTASTTNTPSSVTIMTDSRMSEDYILTNDILVPATSVNPAAVVPLSDGTTTALTIVTGSGLQHLVPDAASQSGWGLHPVPSGASAQEVVAGLDASGVAHAFYQDGAHTYHGSLSGGGVWASPDVFAVSMNLGVATVPLTNELVAYGVMPDGNLQFIRKSPTGTAWQAAVCDFNKALLGGQVVVKMTTASNWTMAAAVNGQLQYFTGVNATLASGPQTVTTPNPVTRVHFAYHHRNSTMVMFSDTKHTLYTSVGFGDQIAAIPNASVVHGAGIVGTNALLRFYAVAPDGNLWILNQTGWDQTQAPIWAPIFPLDTEVAQVVAPLAVQDGASLFATGIDATLHAIVQHPVTTDWTRLKVQRPSSKEPYHLTRYRTQITVYDANGNPAPNVPVTISASVETAILVGGVTYFIGPGQGQTATCTTAVTGILTITSPATSLSAASYTLTAPGLSAPLTVYPDQDIHAFLAGTGSIHTGSASIPPISAETLKSATVNGQPLAPGLSDDLATAAAQGIVHAATAVPRNGAAAARAPALAGWALDLRDRDQPRFHRFATRDELQAHLSVFEASPPLGSIGDDISQFFGDVWHAIERGAMEVVHWVVDTVNAVVKLAVKIGDDIVQLADMAIKGIEDAISVVHSIFNAIGAFIEQVLDWLKDLFSWHDIWNTKRVFEHLMRGALPALSYMIGNRAVVEANNFFTNLKQTIDSGLDAAAARLAGQTIGQIANPTNPALAARGQRLYAANAPTGSAAQNNWLLSKATETVSGSGVLNSVSASVPANIADKLWGVLKQSNVAQDLENALSAFEDFFKTIYDNPRDFSTRGAADLIEAAKSLVDFVLDLMDTTITIILDIVAAALDGLDAIITEPLGEIPVVSWLYRNVICPSDQQEDLTIVALCSLLVAIPATLVYKIGNDDNPPFSDADTQAILETHFTPPSAHGALAAPMGGLPISAGVQAWLVRIISVFQACVDMAADGFASSDQDGQTSVMTKVSGWLDIVINSILQVLTWPNREIFNFDWDWKELTPAQIMMRATWIGAWVPLLVNGVLLVIPTPANGSIAEALDPLGKTFLVVWGGLTFAVGLVGSILGVAHDDPPTANGYNIADAVLAPLPNLTQFLRYNSAVEGSDGITLGIKLIVNDVADIAAGFLQAEAK